MNFGFTMTDQTEEVTMEVSNKIVRLSIRIPPTPPTDEEHPSPPNYNSKKRRFCLEINNEEKKQKIDRETETETENEEKEPEISKVSCKIPKLTWWERLFVCFTTFMCFIQEVLALDSSLMEESLRMFRLFVFIYIGFLIFHFIVADENSSVGILCLGSFTLFVYLGLFPLII